MTPSSAHGHGDGAAPRPKKVPPRYKGRTGPPPNPSRKKAVTPDPIERIGVDDLIDAAVATKKLEAERRPDGTFAPGSSGNPYGREPVWYAPGVRLSLGQICRDVIVQDPNKIRRIIDKGLDELHPMAYGNMLKFIAERAEGMPRRAEGDQDRPPIIFLTQHPIGYDPLAAQSAERRAAAEIIKHRKMFQASSDPTGPTLAHGVPYGMGSGNGKIIDHDPTEKTDGDGETERAL